MGQETLLEPATGRECSLRTTSLNRQSPPSIPRRAGYPGTEQMSRKMLRNVEKRAVHTARNGPSPPPTPAGGPVAKPEMSTADRLGSSEGSSRAGPPQQRFFGMRLFFGITRSLTSQRRCSKSWRSRTFGSAGDLNSAAQRARTFRSRRRWCDTSVTRSLLSHPGPGKTSSPLPSLVTNSSHDLWRPADFQMQSLYSCGTIVSKRIAEPLKIKCRQP